jgi:cation diffusion facilitator CzcD-associated flavoprotein CzcO
VASSSGEERACVIGAGKSGLIACKVLKQRGIPFDCFEAGSQVRTRYTLYPPLHVQKDRLLAQAHPPTASAAQLP